MYRRMFLQFQLPFEVHGDNLSSYEGENYDLPNTIYLEGDNSLYLVPSRSVLCFRIGIPNINYNYIS